MMNNKNTNLDSFPIVIPKIIFEELMAYKHQAELVAKEWEVVLDTLIRLRDSINSKKSLEGFLSHLENRKDSWINQEIFWIKKRLETAKKIANPDWSLHPEDLREEESKLIKKYEK